MNSLSKPLYATPYGTAYLGDAIDLLKCLPEESIDLVLTSPPFALLRQKEYGNVDQNEYVDWLLSFTIEVKRVLKETGSFLLDLGGAYRRERPVRSLYNFPQKLPEFFIKLLTDAGDTVLDIFAGSNTTGVAAESLGRKWIAFEDNQTYLATSTFRFLNKIDEKLIRILYEKLNSEGAAGITIPQVIQLQIIEPEGEIETARAKF